MPPPRTAFLSRSQSLYKLIVPESLWAWQRVRLANLLSPDGPTWGDIFSAYNSGTYNNAYGVLSLANWAPGEALLPNMLTYVEQIPGLVVYGDVTRELEKSHMSMYNVPYWPQIYEMSGYKAVIDAKRDRSVPLSEDPIAGLSYQLAPRAKIFRRDHGKVVSLPTFIDIMRYNDYQNDPYANSPWDAICSRGDLAKNGGPDGCYDTKVSSYSSFDSFSSYVINGPTIGDGSLPPFSWSQYPTVSHIGCVAAPARAPHRYRLPPSRRAHFLPLAPRASSAQPPNHLQLLGLVISATVVSAPAYRLARSAPRACEHTSSTRAHTHVHTSVCTVEQGSRGDT